VAVELRHSSRDPGQVTGYAVGLAGHSTAAGDTIWYGGGRLAADLSLPRVRVRWAGTPDEPRSTRNAARIAAEALPPPLGMYQDAADVARTAATAMNAATAAAIAGAAADLLSAAAYVWEGRRGGPLTAAAGVFDRAAYERQRPKRVPRYSNADQLRSMARLISVMGAIREDTDTTAVLHLILNIAAIAEHLADIREAQQRLHQAQAARNAARLLSQYGPPGSGGLSTPRANHVYLRRDRHPDHYGMRSQSGRRER
jgi:hypothetical protein